MTLRVGGEPSKLDEVSEFITSLFPGAVLKVKAFFFFFNVFPFSSVSIFGLILLNSHPEMHTRIVNKIVYLISGKW